MYFQVEIKMCDRKATLNCLDADNEFINSFVIHYDHLEINDIDVTLYDSDDVMITWFSLNDSTLDIDFYK